MKPKTTPPSCPTPIGGSPDGGVPAAQSAESFETIFERLSAIAGQLEEGALSLEASVALYEEGMTLAERCQALLSDVEERIEMLRERANGDPQP